MAYSNLNEGYGKVLRYGAYAPMCSEAALDEQHDGAHFGPRWN